MKAGDKYQACVDALAAYANGAGFSQVVIGLSGGIDSSVTAVMAVDAFGAKNVHGVLRHREPYGLDLRAVRGI